MKCVLLCAFVITTVLFGCKKDESNPADQTQYTDKLTLGTGTSGFTIVGESTTFTKVGGSAHIFWRLESSVDMAGSSVKIRIDKQGASGYAPFDSVTTSNPQSYGHIMLSSFSFTGTGSFRATGVLVTAGRSVASKDFTAN